MSKNKKRISTQSSGVLQKAIHPEMTYHGEQTYLAIALSLMGTELQKVDILDEEMNPAKRKNMTYGDEVAVGLYKILANVVSPTSLSTRKEAMKEGLRKLVNEEKGVNFFLFSTYVVRLWAEECGSKVYESMMVGKCEFIDDYFAKDQKDKAPRIRKTSMRAADNLYRQFTGRAQLSDEVRDMRLHKFDKKK